jgi:hypothetical protein
MSDSIIGTCSICGGTVSVPNAYLLTRPPVPRCDSCGASKKSDLPVVEMEGENPEKRKLLTERFQ